MKLTLWILCLLSIFGIINSENVFLYFNSLGYYQLESKSLIEIVLSVSAGIFATKASDSSHEIKSLLKISKIDDLIGKAETAEERVKLQQEKLDNIEYLLKSEVESEFAKDMILRHKEQLEYHWREILKLETLIENVSTSSSDIELRDNVRKYLIKSRYIDYMGRNFLQNIPIIGGLIHILFGPLWDELYYRNMHKINKLFKSSAKDELKK